LALLARWNRKVNLTSLNVDPPDEVALKRLILEPLAAADLVRPSDMLAVDLGSGGGSPALPLKIARPWLRVVLVESRLKKCGFLREAARDLELSKIEVHHGRLEELPRARPDLSRAVDLVTMRAIRANSQTWSVVSWLLKSRGRLLWFGGVAEQLPPTLTLAESHGTLIVAERSSLQAPEVQP
jgi:16S rRNA (guanine527-N7)-methyltransferase